MLLTVTITLDVIFDSQSRLHKRNLRKRGTENSDNKANKRKQTSGPALVFKLKEEDINTDIQAIRDVSHFLFTIVSFLTCKKKRRFDHFHHPSYLHLHHHRKEII